MRIYSVLLALAASGIAQVTQPIPQPREPQPAEAAVKPPEPDKEGDPLFRGMRYRLIGPFRGGRSLTVAGVAGDPRTYYFGAEGGGLWKTTDGAITWSPLFDKEGTAAIGSLAVAASDHNVIYAGTGEACLRGNVTHGDGIYKSTDAGKTWKNVGLKDSRAVGKLIIHPSNPDIAFVAALGHQYGPNTERGIFRTTDGGKTWDKVLYKDEKTGGIDIAFDPNNPNILFATLWQVQRTPWSLDSGGPGSGLYRSTDGGSTWKKLEGKGLPKGPWGRSGVAVAANSERVYTLIQAEGGGLFRSDNGGDTWELINENRGLRQRAWYYMHITLDPKNPDVLYIMNVEFFKSVDGGHTFNHIRVPHGDNHALWIDPQDTQRMIQGNDGGATVSLDGGKHWTSQDNQPTAQFYHVVTDNRFPYFVYGAQQDNSTIAIASRSDSGHIDKPDWYPVGGGESGYIAPYPPDPLIVYAGGYEGGLSRFDKRTGQIKAISPGPEVTDGEGAAKLEHRFQWTSPTFLSPHDPDVIYHAGERLFKSTDRGQHWETISPDLSRNDKSKQQASGGIEIDDTGTEYYDLIFAAAESPLTKGQIWAGTDDGLVHLTRDGGKTWTNVTPKAMPEWSRVSLIEPSLFDAGTAYVAANRYQLDDLQPYIYRTDDYGKSWTRITNGIPDNVFVRAVRSDPKRRGLLYAGTESGVYFSLDEGKRWQALKLNLPVTPVHDLVVKNDDLVLATHGRAFWILDDLSPLRQFQDEAKDKALHFYKPKTALRIQSGGSRRPVPTAGDNPPNGAVLYYYVKAEPKEVTIDILGRDNKVIRHYSSKRIPPPTSPPDPESPKPKPEIEVAAGLNRFSWDLRETEAPRIPGYFLWDYESGSQGPLVVPGTYQVRITVDGESALQSLEVALDPRVNVSQNDLDKQYALESRVHSQLARVYQTALQMLDVRKQITDLNRRMGEAPQAKELIRAGEQLDKKIDAALEKLVNFKITASEDSLAYPLGLDGKLATLAEEIGHGSDGAPTEPEIQLFQKYSRMLDQDLSEWGSLIAKDLPAYQKLAAAQNPGPVVIPK